MTELDRLRLYLRDSDCKAFNDVELADLLEITEDFYEAVGLGWLLIGSAVVASQQTGAKLSKTVGKVSETYASADSTTSIGTAFQLATYWFSRSGSHGAQWYSAEPATGFLADTIRTIRALEGSEYYASWDLSRLLSPVGW